MAPGHVRLRTHQRCFCLQTPSRGKKRPTLKNNPRKKQPRKNYKICFTFVYTSSVLSSLSHLLVVVLRAAGGHHPPPPPPSVGRVVARVCGPLSLPPVTALAVRLTKKKKRGKSHAAITTTRRQVQSSPVRFHFQVQAQVNLSQITENTLQQHEMEHTNLTHSPGDLSHKMYPTALWLCPVHNSTRMFTHPMFMKRTFTQRSPPSLHIGV